LPAHCSIGLAEKPSMSMRSPLAIAALIVNALGFSGAARAQSPAPAVARKTDDREKPKNYLERTIAISGQLRERWEDTDGANFSVTPADSYVMSRVRLGVAYKPVSWLRLFSEAQDSRVLFYQTKPSNAVDDPFDFRQGYVEAGSLEGPGVKARVGRQDLFIGSNRLLTTGDWSNVTKPYDAARGTITTGFFAVDLIAGSQVQIDPNRMDRHKPGEHFYVAYSTFRKLIQDASIEPYLMAKTQFSVKGKDGKAGGADTLYVGGRIVGKTRGRIDYNFEGLREAGGYADDTIRAWGYVGGGGWTVSPALWKLHVSSDYQFASGNDGKKDGVHDQFDYLYGAQQPPTSLTGLFAWRNIRNWRAGADFKPMRKLTIKIDYRDYWLATVQDGLYNGIGTQTVLNAKATSSHVGEGVDTLVSYAINGKTSFSTGVATLSPGAYLVQSRKTSGFVYPFLCFTRSF
jgi:Alginate export